MLFLRTKDTENSKMEVINVANFYPVNQKV
jgi:hypothetical protein